DLLDVSRIVTGKLRLEARSVDLVSVIVAAMEAVQTAAEAKGIRLETSLDAALGPISADPNRLQQVVWHLLTNAIKFTATGGVGAVPARRRYGSEAVRPVSLRGVRVLVVDDEADALELMRMILRSSGADVMAAACAEEALEQVEQWHPDILVSDIGLPGDDGYVLIQKLRQRQGDYGRSMPALAVTAYARAEDRTRALSAGFQLHVAKPLEPADFVA